MKKLSFAAAILFVALFTVGCRQESTTSEITMSKETLMDKIKGGWAGQTIGCTYGGPTEFEFRGTMINDNIDIDWPEGRIAWYFDHAPGLYDDVYMDLTFVDVFDKFGLDADINEFAKAFANADYPLWHANQQARYNIQQGIMPPESGAWQNNPHADDIDFQIEADYAGLMAPAMPNAATYYSDAIGHIMNYGDGWYGGVYVAAMYALAFTSDDVEYVVSEALKTIPSESKYYKCMSDIIAWHSQYPDNWEIAWALCQKNWSFEVGCPEGVRDDLDIDALINSAYIVIGLLYGEGDFGKTLDISTRCGQDSDCNPASAAGILGTMLGYSNIPEKWMPNLREVEDRPFKYTDISLNKTYQMSFDQALQVIEKNGGKVGENDVTIHYEAPVAVRYEESFPGLWPQPVMNINKQIEEAGEIAFNGKACVVRYSISCPDKEYVAEVDVILDGEVVETAVLPVIHHDRKQELFYKYDLAAGDHKLSFDWKNPCKDASLSIGSVIAYD